MKKTNRRKFIRNSILSAAALSIRQRGASNIKPSHPKAKGSYMGGFAAEKLEKVRVAVIGVGARGPNHLRFLATLDNVEIVAISDLYEDLVTKERVFCESLNRGHDNIATYFGGEHQWKLMLKETQLDAVFICTNWQNHAEMAIESMKHGAHAFVEVPMAVSIDEMWQIIDTSETTQKHCMMMENVNYSRDELMVLNMCRQGIIGEILHGEAAYIHELRFQMAEENRGTGSWRTHHYANRNGNLYPTHGLGPVAQYMNLCRGEDNFDSIVSMSTQARGRQLYATSNYPPDHKWNALDYRGGDLNTSIIKTVLGRTIMIQWDETSPRPYSRHNLIQGTKGILAGFPTRAAFDGGFEDLTDNHHLWIQGEQLDRLYEKYDHPLYKRGNEMAKGSGHGGMDGLMMLRIVECLQQGLPMDQNVYEGCSWSAVAPLSEASVESESAPQKFPDFTRGRWKDTLALDIVE